ncbi:hypothetical protein ACFQ0X_42810 [Streptomyces rectiviolaceus]|uniref:hypothetical protein n=1 Tax=Streptomyces rectiviolaceus TaxID=332591 RepID=UPI00362769AD
MQFVFHVPLGTTDFDRLPQRTTLQHAVVGHLRAGRHWRLSHGWTPLPAPSKATARPEADAINSRQTPPS